MKYNTAQPYLAAFVVMRHAGKVALILRTQTGWMDGFYALPAGKVEVNERASAGAVREAYEEAGVTIQESDLRPVYVCHRHSEDDEAEAWVDVIFEATKWEGEAYNAEPDKHGELKWFDPLNLPKNTIPACKFYLKQIAAGKTYSEYGWEA